MKFILTRKIKVTKAKKAPQTAPDKAGAPPETNKQQQLRKKKDRKKQQIQAQKYI